MFFTIPPPESLELQVPDNLKAITLRISNIQPSGEINVYSYPAHELYPVTFDAQRPEQRFPATSGLLGIQKMSGAETYTLELVSTECGAPDPEASKPRPIVMR